MQKPNLEDYYFFENKDGSIDELAMQLNCFESSVYHILKNCSQLDRSLIAPLFIREINPTLWYNNSTGVFRIYNISSNITSLWTKYIKLNQYVEKNNKNALYFLESLLDKGQIVILQTVFEKISFSHKYQPDYDLNTYDQGIVNHVNIILHHDEDKIYFVEKIPYTIIKENYVPYELNRQIGVAPKSEIGEACSFFMRCHTLEVNEHELNENASFQKDIVNLIHSIADNYAGGIEQDGVYTRYSGVKGMEKFAQLCDEGYKLNNYYSTEGWSIRERIAFDLWMLYGSRTILMYYLNSVDRGTEGFEDLKLLMETIDETRAQWIIIERIMGKQLLSNSTKLNSKLGDRIRQLIVLENKLNALLKSFS